ncbi:MAG: hypothetical protein WBB55_01245, partial [Anaerolineales bacterium]
LCHWRYCNGLPKNPQSTHRMAISSPLLNQSLNEKAGYTYKLIVFPIKPSLQSDYSLLKTEGYFNGSGSTDN